MLINLDKNELHKELNNVFNLGTAVQVGTAVLRELSEGGNLGNGEIKGEEVNISGVRNLLTATLVNELSKR